MIPFGARNIHCNNCGDERGGSVGHESSECRYRRGMTAGELAATMDDETRSRYWETVVDAYFAAQLGDEAGGTQ